MPDSVRMTSTGFGELRFLDSQVQGDDEIFFSKAEIPRLSSYREGGAQLDRPRASTYSTAVASISIINSGNANRATPNSVLAGRHPAAPSRWPTTSATSMNLSTSVV